MNPGGPGTAGFADRTEASVSDSSSARSAKYADIAQLVEQRPFKAVMLGSSPARITITIGYSQGVKAPVFDTGTAGSNPAIPAMIRYSSGSGGQTANLLIAGWRQKLQPIKCNCPVGSCSRPLLVLTVKGSQKLQHQTSC